MDRRDWSYRSLPNSSTSRKGTISKAFSLVSLPEPVQELVEKGTSRPTLPMRSHDSAMPQSRSPMAEQIVERKLTAEDAAQAVKARRLGVRGPEAEARSRSRPIQVEVRPGIVAIVRGVTTEAEAVEVLRQAATLLKKRSPG